LGSRLGKRGTWGKRKKGKKRERGGKKGKGGKRGKGGKEEREKREEKERKKERGEEKEERHYHDKPPSAPAEEGNIDMMRLLGVRPIDIISTTIMTTTLNGSLPASSDCIAPSQPPALCRYWPPAAPAAAARRGEI
jgi:hypothetical protein